MTATTVPFKPFDDARNRRNMHKGMESSLVEKYNQTDAWQLILGLKTSFVFKDFTQKQVQVLTDYLVRNFQVTRAQAELHRLFSIKQKNTHILEGGTSKSVEEDYFSVIFLRLQQGVNLRFLSCENALDLLCDALKHYPETICR